MRVRGQGGKDFLEYFLWNEVGVAGGRRWMRVRGRGRKDPLGQTAGQTAEHDLTSASSRVLGRWRESKNIQQQLGHTRVPLVKVPRHAKGVARRTNVPDRAMFA